MDGKPDLGVYRSRRFGAWILTLHYALPWFGRRQGRSILHRHRFRAQEHDTFYAKEATRNGWHKVCLKNGTRPCPGWVCWDQAPEGAASSENPDQGDGRRVADVASVHRQRRSSPRQTDRIASPFSIGEATACSA